MVGPTEKRSVYLEASAEEAGSVKRVIDPEELKHAVGAPEAIIDDIRDMIIWGVYGDSDELLRITEMRDVEHLEDTEENARAFQKLYLKGLLEEPSSFGSTYEIESRKSLDVVQAFLKDNYVVGVKYSHKNERAERVENLVGMATLKREEGVKSHIAYLGKLYVHPAHRTRSIARNITDHMIEYAVKNGIEQVHLIVTVSNKFVVEFYERLGFERGEIQYRAVKIDGQYYDWLPMKLSIRDYKVEQSKSRQKLP